MDEQVEKILMEQLELLHEKSQTNVTAQELSALTKSMCEVSLALNQYSLSMNLSCKG